MHRCRLLAIMTVLLFATAFGPSAQAGPIGVCGGDDGPRRTGILVCGPTMAETPIGSHRQWKIADLFEVRSRIFETLTSSDRGPRIEHNHPFTPAGHSHASTGRTDSDPQQVPEPSTWLLIALGAGGLTTSHFRRGRSGVRGDGDARPSA